MSKRENSITRREFISRGIRGFGLIGLGSAIGLTAGQFLRNTKDKKISNFEQMSNYDLSEFYTVDPALIQYKETGKIKPAFEQSERTEFQSLRGIAIDPDDRIYVATDKAIQVFSKDSTHLSEITLNASPRCLTIADDGSIYVGMKEHLEIYDAKGACKANWESLGGNAVLTSIAIAENKVFVADAGNRSVLLYNSSGKLVRRIGKEEKDSNIPGFVVPSPYFDLAVAPDGLLKVANPGRHTIEAYTLDGDFEFAWGKTSMGIEGFCGCCNPVNFAVLPDGRFVTCEKGLPRVKIYGADGAFTAVVAGPEAFTENQKSCAPINELSSCQTGGLDVAVDSQGRVLVMDPVEKVVRIFTPIRKT
ncbi:TPA: hypothetical protein EYP66_05510 [Candidatus Poribacteria bacterium]|nr:hypothetical protein [Candidatus Poribacteria bacterium]